MEGEREIERARVTPQKLPAKRTILAGRAVHVRRGGFPNTVRRDGGEAGGRV
jgi:hypothetical protein